MIKVYDLVMFSHELDLLEIRLNILDEVVDKFVIVELDKTHSGKTKPFILEDNWERFEQFDIDYYQLVPPKELIGWELENWHRRQLQSVASWVSSDDIVMISDIDEIPNPEVIKGRYVGRYIQDMYYYYLNAKAPYNWQSGTIVLPQWQLMKRDIQELRNEGHQNRCTLPKIPNGGWHFSSVGKGSDILTKFQSFAHTEFNITDVLKHRRSLRDVHGEDLDIVKIDKGYPKYLQKTWQSRWRYLVYE